MIFLIADALKQYTEISPITAEMEFAGQMGFSLIFLSEVGQ